MRGSVQTVKGKRNQAAFRKEKASGRLLCAGIRARGSKESRLEFEQRFDPASKVTLVCQSGSEIFVERKGGIKDGSDA